MDRSGEQMKHQCFSLPSIPSKSIYTPSAARRSLAAKQDSKPDYKVVYPLRNRKKYGIGSDCNAAPNAEYIVTGHGYKFTRHNNQLTMNINSDVFFGDEPIPIIKPFPNRGVLKRQTQLPQIQNSKGSNKQLTHAELQQRLEESTQKCEKLHGNLIKASVKLEEKNFRQQLKEMKVVKQQDIEMNEIMTKQKQERKEMKEAHLKEIEELTDHYTIKLDYAKTEGTHRQLLLKEKIEQQEYIIKQDKEKLTSDILKRLKWKEEELTAIHENAIKDRKMNLSSKLNHTGLAQIKDTENSYRCKIFDMKAKHEQEIKKLFKPFESLQRKQKELIKMTNFLQAVEMEIEQLKLEKEDMISDQAKIKNETQGVTNELNEYKAKFQSEVDKVKMKYSNRISELTIEATRLRKLLSRKSNEITEMIIKEERETREHLYRIRKAMLQARCSSSLPSTIKHDREEKQHQ